MLPSYLAGGRGVLVEEKVSAGTLQIVKHCNVSYWEGQEDGKTAGGRGTEGGHVCWQCRGGDSGQRLETVSGRAPRITA